ncbi:AbrB/MazE/SpoVT family DNA-binding domain-containing protein [Patescibacteria group bacterium]|nr:AbrB/MazE/SpoVT family DNA-binding domain-containing protein [Patescibacteria group bacterium]
MKEPKVSLSRVRGKVSPRSAQHKKIDDDCEQHLMGSTVLGERGQLVIPKDIRERLGLKSGAKLLVMNHPNGPIIIFPVEQMQTMLTTMTAQLTNVTDSKPQKKSR